MLEFEFQPRKTGSVAGSIIFTSNLPTKYVFFTLSGKGILAGQKAKLDHVLLVDAPEEVLVVRALGFANVRPLRVRVQIATSVDFSTASMAVDSTFTTSAP